MSKTRRDIGANRRHFGGQDSSNGDHRINRLLKKIKKSSFDKRSEFNDDDNLQNINHSNYQDFLDDEDDN
jgi:hypothetical protein